MLRLLIVVHNHYQPGIVVHANITVVLRMLRYSLVPQSVLKVSQPITLMVTTSLWHSEVVQTSRTGLRMLSSSRPISIDVVDVKYI